MRIRQFFALMLVAMGIICFQFGSSTPQPARAQDGSSDGADFLVWQRTLGIVPGQMLRVTVANPGETREPPPIFFLCKVFDQNGALVFQSDQREVPSRHFRYEDINFEDLSGVVGEPGTGRRQVIIQLLIRTARGARSSNVNSSLETINKDTGATASHWYYHDLLVSSFQSNR
jgi:hypothetical protein